MGMFELPQRPVQDAAPAAGLQKKPGAAKKRFRWTRGALLLGAFVALAGGWFTWSKLFGRSAESDHDFLTEEVKRRDLKIVVVEDGNVESAANIDLKCKIEGGSQILWIIPDGTPVTRGTRLVSLSSAAIDEKIMAQQIVVERGRAALFQAREDHSVAEIALREYPEGTYVKDLQLADSAIYVQEQNLKSARNLLEHSEMMFRKGHINKLQLETNKDAVERSKLDLDAAKTARKLLVDFTREKTLKQLQSARDVANAKAAAEKSAFDMEAEKLRRYKEQRDLCTITAPQDGTVIYANDNNRWGSNLSQIEEGAAIKEFQTILRLPDMSKMQVKALVHETKVGRLRPGMPAVVKIRDIETKGTIVQVMSQAEMGRAWMSSVKEYATYIRIDNMSGLQDLKPNMTAEVNILAKEVKNAVSVPLQAVVEKGDHYFSYLRLPGTLKGYEERRVVIGDHNDKYIEIVDGLKEKDLVILNPRATCPEAREVVQGRNSALDLHLPPDVRPPANPGGTLPGQQPKQKKPRAPGQPLAEDRQGGGGSASPVSSPERGAAPGRPASGSPSRAEGPKNGGKV